MNFSYEDIQKIAIKIGFSYLNAGFGKWEDGAGNVHPYNLMSDKYLNNCKKFIDKGIEEIQEDGMQINSSIRRCLNDEFKISKDELTYAMLKSIKKQIIVILKEKKKEINNYKKYAK